MKIAYKVIQEHGRNAKKFNMGERNKYGQEQDLEYLSTREKEEEGPYL